MSTAAPAAVRARNAADTARQLNDLAGRLRTCGVVVRPSRVTPDGLQAGLAMIDQALAGVMEQLPTAGASRRARLAAMTVELHDCRRSIRATRMAGRGRPVDAISQAIGRLRRVRSTAGILDRVCAESAEACGLSRVALSVFSHGEWSVRGVHPASDDGTSPWKDGLTEWMVFESGTPRLVDARPARTGADPMAGAAPGGDESYVVVPIQVSSGVLGLLRGDHHPSDRPVDDVDRDLLATFARAFGDVYERSALLERLERQRKALVTAFEAELDAADRLVDAEFDLSEVEHDDLLPRASEDHGAIDELLTPREREVVALIVAGAANGAIAERLVISTGTVKSHVKRILRKLGAANRSEAISRYLELKRTGA
ncbi:LuxR C-terminal-related transcriptional regulator [Patulibacter sp. NPDC049589]|uniref:helix-turn-helix transcriptional regulator n=1 Tax=Patulibacter sp. NPDC049589 TaxID=3154731 RepID=UPI00343A08D6